MTPATLAHAQGGYYAITGVWPLVHMRSFEAVTGPKQDHWLVHTVAGLLVVNGKIQLASVGSGMASGAPGSLGLGLLRHLPPSTWCTPRSGAFGRSTFLMRPWRSA